MQRIPLRELSGRRISELAHGEAVAITNDNVVCGVMQPVDSQRVAEFVDANLSRISHNIDLGEAALRRGEPMVSLDEALGEAGADHEAAIRSAAETSGAEGDGAERSGEVPVRRLAIRELNGDELQAAAEAGERIALTNRNVLCAIIEPVSTDWVERLIEQNLSRLATTVARAERDLELGTRMSTLDEVVGNAMRA